ncbi:hypothetical protein D9615_009890 [Tricholomella constricta]|uniref:tRNA-dihydrouridine(16/17) synthase [NAD(P)(+)] n=1 Tax=Tricholomella constricta TaxID=117010 RepID=A0A8H5GZU1_9AGAR|nr:hypothetical protein D9615_009890 [Tricholomella constricta]
MPSVTDRDREQPPPRLVIDVSIMKGQPHRKSKPRYKPLVLVGFIPAYQSSALLEGAWPWPKPDIQTESPKRTLLQTLKTMMPVRHSATSCQAEDLRQQPVEVRMALKKARETEDEHQTSLNFGRSLTCISAISSAILKAWRLCARALRLPLSLIPGSKPQLAKIPMERTQEARPKLDGYEFYHRVLGSPKYVCGAIAFRKLTRRYGAKLVYTPMINAKSYSLQDVRRYNTQILPRAVSAFSLASSSDTNRLLIVQFWANSPEHLLAAAKLVEAHCDAVDINLGCPQEIARRGYYGAFLMDEWDLVFDLINTLHKNLSVPVTTKFRVFPDVERTVAYAQMLKRAGTQILTCHGRTREQRGQNSGLASYAHIRAVKAAVRVPVFANGNVLFSSNIARCLAELARTQ